MALLRKHLALIGEANLKPRDEKAKRDAERHAAKRLAGMPIAYELLKDAQRTLETAAAQLREVGANLTDDEKAHAQDAGNTLRMAMTRLAKLQGIIEPQLPSA